jgi:hypothetical protein
MRSAEQSGESDDRETASATAPPYIADLFGATRSRMSSEKAHRLLNWSPRIDLAAGQAAALDWLVDIGLVSAAQAERKRAAERADRDRRVQ